MIRVPLGSTAQEISTSPSGKSLGWFVGYLETRGNVYFFATNIEGENSAAVRERRIELTKSILAGLGYLPRQ